MPKVVPNIPTLNNEQMIELAQNAANAYISTNEMVKQASITDFLSLYLDVFTVAYKKVEERIDEKNRKVENFEDCEKLPINSIR